MSIKNKLNKKIKNFVIEFSQDNDKKVNSDNEYYSIIMRDIPELINNLLHKKFSVKGSAGKGIKTKYPWIGIFNKAITTTAQKGIYIVLLFKSDLSGFYLSLGQGITHFDLMYKKDKYKYAQQVAKYFRETIQSNTFSLDEIDLISNKGDLGYGYEKTNIISKFYSINKLEDYDLASDLIEIASIYDEIYENMKPRLYEDVIKSVINDDISYLTSIDKAEEIINKALSESTDQKEINIKTVELVEVPTAPKRNYVKIKSGIIKKIDYAHKAKNDSEIGLEGEELVLTYEQNRLRALGLEEYISQIEWVSVKTDSEGFDIESFDIVDEKVVKRYIEVKTTVGGKYEKFYLSQNELNVSRNLKDNYWIYRLYDINSDTPKLYCINGPVDKNFIIRPNSYVVSLN